MGAVAGEDGTIGERLATADAARFVGRRAELERLERLLVEVPERNIVLLHGSGGIGKSTLLRELVRRADRAGWPSRIIEARDLPEQPEGCRRCSTTCARPRVPWSCSTPGRRPSSSRPTSRTWSCATSPPGGWW